METKVLSYGRSFTTPISHWESRLEKTMDGEHVDHYAVHTLENGITDEYKRFKAIEDATRAFARYKDE